MTGKKKIKQDEAVVTISGTTSKRTKEKFYTFCDIKGANGSQIIGGLIEHWVADVEAELAGKLEIKKASSEEEKYEQLVLNFDPAETSASPNQLAYIKILCAMRNIPFSPESIRSFRDADVMIKELKAKINDASK